MNAVLMFVLLLPAVAGAELSLVDSRLVYQDGGLERSLELEPGAAVKVDNSDLVFVYLDKPEALKAAGQSGPSLVFFDRSGRMVGAYGGNEGFEPEMCAAASLSPDRKILALDNGTWLLRVWIFLNFPDFSPATEAEEALLSYYSSDEYPALLWVDGNTVLITDISEAPVARPCPADPCEPLDVVVHHIREWSTASLAKGTELCNYNLESLSKRTATVVKTCTKRIDDWASNEASLRTVTREKVQVPQQ